MHIVFSSLLTFAVAAAQYGPDPDGLSDGAKCAWRELVMLRAAEALESGGWPAGDSSWLNLVEEALNIRQLCPNATVTPSHKVKDRHRDGGGFSDTGCEEGELCIFVAAEGGGGDDEANGTEGEPLATVHEGLRRARAALGGSAGTPVSVVLRGGTHYLRGGALELGAQDSGLTLRSDGGAEAAWLSAGVPLAGMQWEHERGRVWSADISEMGLGDLASLRVDGRRVSPARFPNADPEVDFWPVGYLTSNESFTESGGDWLDPKIAPNSNPALEVNVSAGRDFDAQFSRYRGGIGGTCSIYTPPFSFWCQSPPFSPGCGGCFTWNIPSGLRAAALLERPGFPYAKPENAVLMAWRKAHWANWAFEVDSLDSNGTVKFGLGGFQGARGGPGSDWFIQNVREELDTPDEFYYDRGAQRLYVVANETNVSDPPSTERAYVAIPSTNHTLLNGTASMARPITNVTLRGLGFRDTAWTMLQPHGVPSGGDWALERMAAVFFEGSEGLVVENCTFFRLGGNALMLSRFARDARIAHNEFAWLGGSAIAAWGWTDEISDGGVHGVDGTHGDFPRYTLVEANLFREVGVWEKQSSAFFQAKAAQTTLRGNVAFNLARAAFNFNDGFGGGDIIEENVLFNTCRESSDHGPINSWDRQPFVTTVRTGEPSAQMEWREVTRNVVIANYGGSKEVDNDDGSLFWRIHHNVMFFGWGQKFKCGAIVSRDNLKAYIEIGAKFDAGCLLNKTSAVYDPNEWSNDTMVVIPRESTFEYRQCWGSGYDVTAVTNNTIYVQNASVKVSIRGGDCPGGKSTFDWHDEPGTLVHTSLPEPSEVLAMANAVLDG